MITPIMNENVALDPNTTFETANQNINNVTEQVNNPFLAAAIEATVSNSITNGLVQLKTDELIARFPDGITVYKFDIVKNGDSEFAVVLFKEAPTAYYNGGTVLNNIVSKWRDLFGDCETASAELEKCGGVKLKLSKAVSKKTNRPFTKVEVVQ